MWEALPSYLAPRPHTPDLPPRQAIDTSLNAVAVDEKLAAVAGGLHLGQTQRVRGGFAHNLHELLYAATWARGAARPSPLQREAPAAPPDRSRSSGRRPRRLPTKPPEGEQGPSYLHETTPRVVLSSRF